MIDQKCHVPQGEQRTVHKNKGFRSPHECHGTEEKVRQVNLAPPYGRKESTRESYEILVPC